MKILLLNQFYRPDSAATGQLLADVAEALARRGHEVHVVCTRRCYGGGRTSYAAEEVVRGVRVHRVGATGFGRGNIVGRSLDYISFYVLAWGRATQLPPMDVCVALTTPPLLATLANDLERRRHTVPVHWVMDVYPELLAAFGVLKEKGLLYRLLARASRKVYRRAVRIVSLGNTMTRRLRQAAAPAEKIVVIENWVPGEVVRPISPDRSAARRNWCQDGEASIMYSGNLGMGHHFEPVVHAAKELVRSYPLRVLFVGHGRMRPKLEELKRKLGLTCVDFYPPRPLSDLADSLAAGDIHIVSQRDSTQGLLLPSKIYSVLAAGRPTVFIGPEDTEVAQLVRHSGAGLVVPPGDIAATVGAIRTLLADADLRRRMGARARTWYERHFNRQRSIAKWVRVIEEAGRR